MRKFGSVLAAAMLTAGVAYAQDVNGEDADEQRLETVTATGQLSVMPARLLHVQPGM